jgi:hypothetical protein
VPGLPTITDTYRVAYKWSAPSISRFAVNVMHFKKSGESASSLFAELDAIAAASMYAHTNENVGVVELDITPLDGTSATQGFSTGGAARWKGTGAGSGSIPQVAALAKFNTAVRGRSHQGRAFLPFVDEDRQTAGALNDTPRGEMQTAWDAWHDGLTTDGWEFVVASYKLSSEGAVVSIQIEPRTATQRRRQLR